LGDGLIDGATTLSSSLDRSNHIASQPRNPTTINIQTQQTQNIKTNETWSWRGSQLPPPGGYDWLTALAFKCNVLVQSCLAFLLTSAVTAIVVRMLMTSGVVILFPFFFALRRLGVRLLDFRILTLSYPWLGIPMQRLRARRKPLTPFIMAHLVRVFVLYVMYEASQAFFAEFLYGKVRVRVRVWVGGSVCRIGEKSGRRRSGVGARDGFFITRLLPKYPRPRQTKHPPPNTQKKRKKNRACPPGCSTLASAS
jgi:hypothetical protein